ncbi:MAG TPA: DnaJ domain-containing protein, partial [Propylenella sp.]
MSALALLAAGFLIVGLLLMAFLRTPPADLVRQLRIAGGVLLMAAGLGLVFMRQFALAVPIGIAGFMILRRQAAMRSAGSASKTSSVRSAGLEMLLDHATGEMDGRILAGRREGRMLSDLRLEELFEVAEDFAGDEESLRLLEGYLDRAHPGWRDDIHADQTQRQSAPPRPGGMGAKEAYEILGLEAGASEAEVREAHRRLIKQVHPD